MTSAVSAGMLPLEGESPSLDLLRLPSSALGTISLVSGSILSEYSDKVDPVTKEIVPKETEGKRNRSKLGEIVVVNDENKNLEGNLHNQLDVELIESQRQQIESLSSEISHLRLILSQMQSLMANV